MNIRKILKLSIISLMASQYLYSEELTKDLKEDTKDTISLPSITINARKETEDAQELPFGIFVIDGKEIREKGFFSTEEILRTTPGVSINTSGGANVSSVSIRGVGALYPLSMDDASVAVNMDGSPTSSRHLSLATFDIEQIEILKGPQGTLFGGLGGAGAINIITKKPTQYTEGYFQSEFAEEEHKVDLAIGGSLTESLSTRIAVHQSSYEYPITNIQTGEPVSEPNLLGVRGGLLWDISDDTSALLTIEHQKSEHMGENIVLQPYNDDPKMDLTPGIYDNSYKELDKQSLQIKHFFKNSQLTSISSYSDVYNISPVVFDRLVYQAMMGSSNEYWREQESSDKVFTQDLRLSSLPGADIFWVVGASFLDSDRTYNHSRMGGANFVVYPGNHQFRDFETKRYGVYAETTIPVNEKWKITGGIRQTWDYKKYKATYTQNFNSVQDHDELNDSFTTGRLGVTYALDEDSNLYATVSKGYNPGGFQDYGENKGDAKFKAGSIYSAEVGIKSELLNHRLRINSSIFYTSVKDNYMIDSTGVSSFVVNADTKSIGYELALNWLVTENFNLAGNFAYTKATIKDYVNNSLGGPVDSGNEVPDTPKVQSTISLAYKKALPNINILNASSKLNTRLDYTYMSKRAADVQNHYDLDAYSKVDMHVGLISGDKEIYIYGKNIFDEYYDLYGFYDNATSVKYGAPSKGRIIGLGFKYTF